MSSEIVETTLEKHLNFKNGKSSPDRDESYRIPVYGSNGLIGYSEESNAESNSLIIGRVGSYCGSVYHSKSDCWITDNAIIATPKNEDESYFWYYLLLSSNLHNYRSGSGQPLLNQTTLNSISVSIPADPDQRIEIGEVLNTFDQKIYLNQQTNETLEAMAQAIFKSWFVDFDPVNAKIRAKAEGYDPTRAAMAIIAGISLEQDWDDIEAALTQKLEHMTKEQRTQLQHTAELFPDELVESEIGMVPKGWDVNTTEEILKRFRAPKRVKKDEVEDSGEVVVLEQGEGIIMGYHNDEAGFDASPDNPHFIFGDHTCITHLVIEPFDIAPNVIPLKGEKFDSYWTYYAIKDLQKFQEYRRHWSELKIKKVVTPDNALDESFSELIKPLLIKVNKNRNENLILSQLRDTLLPKLISGEVEV